MPILTILRVMDRKTPGRRAWGLSLVAAAPGRNSRPGLVREATPWSVYQGGCRDHDHATLLARRMHLDGDLADCPVIFPPGRIGQPIQVRLAPGKRVVAVKQPPGWAEPINPHGRTRERGRGTRLPGGDRSQEPVSRRVLAATSPMAATVRALQMRQRKFNRLRFVPRTCHSPPPADAAWSCRSDSPMIFGQSDAHGPGSKRT